MQNNNNNNNINTNYIYKTKNKNRTLEYREQNQDVIADKIKKIYGESVEDYQYDNKVFVLGELLGVEESGLYNGIQQDLVLMKTERAGNKPLYVWIVLPKHEKTTALIKRKGKVFIEGFMTISYTFNNRAVSHTFIVPKKVDILTEEVEIEKSSDFYMNYTVNNRVILEGVVSGEPWREYIPPADNSVTRFLLEIKVGNKKRKIYCTMWDTVNDIEDFKVGMNVRVVGSYNMLKKERGLVIKDGIVVESKKNKLDSYVVVVQRIELIEDSNTVENLLVDTKEKHDDK